MRSVTAVTLATALFFAPAAKMKQDSQQATPRLPLPTGPFGVGRVTYDWIDGSRPEPLSQKAGARREVMVYVWYPTARAGQASNFAPYFPDFVAAKGTINDQDFKDMLRPADEEIRKSGLPHTRTMEANGMTKDSKRYPVLVFSHGWGLQSALYSAELEDLASHGYVVAAVDHPYDATVTLFADGRVAKFARDNFDAAAKKSRGYIDYAYERVEVMATDMRFVIDELSRYDRTPSLRAPFAGHLDLSRIGVFGHSIGGMAAARACQIDSRIRACSDQDSTDDLGSPFPVSTPGSIPKQPLLLFIASSSDIFSQEAMHPSEESLSKQKLSRSKYDEIIQKQQKKQKEILEEIASGSYRIMLFDLPGFTHRSFSDLPLLAADNDQGKWEEAVRNFQIAQSYTRGFFDKFLKSDPNTELDGKSPTDHRVRVDRFGPAAK